MSSTRAHPPQLAREQPMGLFWDLYQQSQISQQGERTATMEMRVQQLEHDVSRLSTLLRDVIGRLEQHAGVDLDRDGRVG
jgi:hypothetical protein